MWSSGMDRHKRRSMEGKTVLAKEDRQDFLGEEASEMSCNRCLTCLPHHGDQLSQLQQ